MRSIRWLFAGVWFCTLTATAASAAPITYSFTTGSLDVTGTVGTTTLFSETGIPLTGTFVEFDAGVPEFLGFEFVGGPSSLISLSSSYGGFDGFTLDTVTIVDGTGFTNFSVTGGPTSFNFSVGPVDATGSATPYTGATPGTVIPFSETSTSLSGTIDLDTGTLTLSGITLLVISGIPGESVPLVVKGDIMFAGMTVPEPATVLLLGILGMALGVRRLA
jgi:hypothetical protein